MRLAVASIPVGWLGKRSQPPRVAGKAGSASGALAATVEHGGLEVKLDGQSELDRFRRGLRSPGPAITDALAPLQLGDGLEDRRLDAARQVGGAAGKQLSVPLDELWKIALEKVHEMLLGSRLEVDDVAPDVAGARRRRGPDGCLQLLRRVGEPGQDRRHADARLDAGLDERFQDLEAFIGRRRAGLGLRPDLAIDRWDAEGH